MTTSRATDDTPGTPQLPALQERLCRLSQSLADLEHRGDSVPATESLRRQVTELQAEVDGLRTALINRSVIEQAKGMLMLRLQIDDTAAFSYLREASNRTNRRVAEIAAEVVRTRAGEPRTTAPGGVVVVLPHEDVRYSRPSHHVRDPAS